MCLKQGNTRLDFYYLLFITMKLIHWDCLEEMKAIPDGSIDAIITDPPYWTTACKWDTVIPFDLMWEQLKRIIKPNWAIVLFGSQPFTSTMVISNINMFKYSLVWEKSMPSDVFMAKRKPLKYHEDILLFYSKQPTFNPIKEERSEAGKKRMKNNIGIVMGNGESNITKYKHSGQRLTYDDNLVNPKSVIKASSVNNSCGKLHPTQKPVALIEYLIKTYTNEWDTVLDFTMWSGTTGVACKNTNREFVGIEMDQWYFDIAKERIYNV